MQHPDCIAISNALSNDLKRNGECRDGRWFLESEFNDEEYDQFEDVYNETKSREVVFYPNRLAVLKRALEIATVLCPLATKTELLNAITAEQAST